MKRELRNFKPIATPLTPPFPHVVTRRVPGLFFGKKRASHPNMNNLLFGRRSYGADALRVAPSNMERAYALCMNIKKTYESLGLQDDVEVPEH